VDLATSILGWMRATRWVGLGLMPLLAQSPDRPPTFRAERAEMTYVGEPKDAVTDLVTLERGVIEGVRDGEPMILLADRIRYWPGTGEVQAEGNIRLEGRGMRLRCGRLHMNWKLGTGEAYALELEVPPEWTLRSDKVEFTSLKHWEFQAVEVSACPQEQPGWVAKISRLSIDLDGFAKFRNAWIWLGKVPTPYFIPWAIYPAKAQRSSGLLIPSVGSSSRYGLSLSVPYFQTLGEEVDLTLNPQYYFKQGLLMGSELRWSPDTTHFGSVSGQWIHQQQDDQRRYRLAIRELWQREDGWQFNADINQASDTLLEADYGQGLGRLGGTSFDSAVFLGKSFSFASFSLSAAEQRSFFTPDDPLYNADFPTNFRRQSLPSVQARLYPISLGPLYLDAGARTGRLAYRIQLGDDLPSGAYNWGRDDVYTRIQGRLGQLGPVRADLQLMARYTRYGASLPQAFFDTQSGDTGFQDVAASAGLTPFKVDGPGITRLLGSGRLQFSGPQVGRLFEDFRLFEWKGELKHVLEPFLAFTDNSRYAKAGVVPRFDEVDARPGVQGSAMGEQSVELGFKQHLMGRPGKGVVFADLVRWRTSVRYHIQPILLSDGRTQQKGWGSVDNDLDVEPDDRVRISFRRSSDVGESGADSSLSADLKLSEGSRLNLAVFSTGINRFLVRQRGIQLGGLHRMWGDRLRLEFSANYAFPSSSGSATGRKGGFATSQVALTYTTPCVATILRYTHVALQVPGSQGREDRVDLSLNLRSLGDLFKLGN
jgi:hypothetical protein